ncbi:MAG: DUF2079 domain-containing protein, partial [Myxococcales bacterium]|nr:DUF2079 domain-containing protein [Myxococcales bacterium]
MTEPTEPTEQVADRDAEGPSDDDMGTPSRFAPLRWVDQLVDISRRWLAVLIVIGVAPALGLVPILHSRVHFRYTYENTLETSYRYHIVLWMFLSVLAMGGVYAGVWLWRRRREPGLTVDAAFRRLNSQLLPILIFPMIIGIWPHRMQVKEPLLTLSVIGVITAIVFIYSYRALGAAPDWCRRALAWIERWRLHWVLLVLFMVQYSAETMRLVLIEHYNLDTHVYDLGIYTNIFWHNMHGNWLGCTFCKLDVHYSGHYDPILIAFTPLFAISPRAETLLYIQTFWLALGAVPTYLIGRHHLKDTWSALMLAGLYLLNPGLSSANMFEFHSLTLSIPIVLWTVHFLDTDNHLAYWPTLAILLLTREDMAIMSCCVGAYAILSRRSATGLATIGIAVAWFVFIKTQVMTSSEVVAVKSTREADSHMYYFAEAVQNTDEGIKGLVLTLVTNPIFALKLLFKTDKLYFLAYQFLPLLCLPLLSGRRLVLFGYGALFIGLVSRHEVFSMGFHYTSLIVPALILATPAGLKRVTSGRLARERGYERQRLKHALLLTAVAASLLTSWKFGPLFGNRFYKAGWNVMKVDQPRDRIRAYQNLQKVIAEIPQEAAVSAASHIGAHVATRDRVVRWGAYRGVDYILLDMRRLKKKERDRMKRLVARKQFLPVIEYDGLTLYKRNPDYKQPGRTTRTRTTASTPRTRPVRLPPRRGAGKDEQDEDAPVGPEGEHVEDDEEDTLEDVADDTA